MRTPFLLTTVAAVLLAGTSIVSAQNAGGDMKQEKAAPNAQMKSEQDKGKPSQPSAQSADPASSKNQTIGQGAPNAQRPAQGAQDKKDAAPNAQSSDPANKGGTTGQGAPNAQRPAQGTQDKKDAAPNAQSSDPANKGGTGQASPTDRRNPNAAERAPGGQQPNAAQGQGPGSSTNQGAAQTQTTGRGQPSGDSVTLTTEQRTTIRRTVLNSAPRVSNVNFSINVGTRVPNTVRLVAVPEPLFRIHPAWRRHLYFAVGDQIIVVDARTHQIVAVVMV